MKIGLDLRFINIHDLYSQFVIELVQSLLLNDKDNFYNIYLNTDIPFKFWENASLKSVWIKLGTLNEQTKFRKILKEDNNPLMIFFDFHKPIFYSWDYYLFVPTLKDVYYQNFKSNFAKSRFLFSLSHSIKKAQKVICFDKNTYEELIERFNVKDSKLNILDAFFPWIAKLKKVEELKVNILLNNNIRNDYLIYSFWNWIEKNLIRLIKAFAIIAKEKDIDLIMLWEDISKNIDIRNEVINNAISWRVHFLWEIRSAEKKFLYENSLWVIFPSLYEPFPFSLNEPLVFKAPIISSNTDWFKSVLWEKSYYFSPISVNAILTSLNKFLSLKKKNNSSYVLDNYNINNTTNLLLNIINKI